MMDRPYFSFSGAQLEQVFSGSRRDPAVLKALLHELAFRNTRSAVRLRGQVEAELQRLDHPRMRTVQPISQKETAVKSGEPERRTSSNFAGGSDPAGVGGPGSASAATVEAWAFDDAQRSVIEAPRSARVIVNAPPGTGKTALACGRVAALLKKGVPAHQIWLFSFTRTAVRELRNRIETLAPDHANVWGIKLATLDSRAWTLVRGFREEVLPGGLGGYEQNIETALEIIRSDHDAVLDHLEEIAHLVVDEAQDLVGIRAEFVLELISRLDRDAGVTILTDDAQAIYGFAEEDVPAEDQGSLPERLRRRGLHGFHEVELTHVYRTTSAALQSLYIEGRRQVLDAIDGNGNAVSVVRECIRRWNDGDVESHDAPSEGALRLFRTRMEVLDAACYLETPYRIRMSGLPACVHPWVGLALAQHTARQLTRDDLERRWASVLEALGGLAPDVNECWKHLHRAAGDGAGVDMQQLRDVLARARPPLEFVTEDAGLAGPTLGTIHGSKGREADEVELMLPPADRNDGYQVEEARVMFVGASRARSRLRVGSGKRIRSSRAKGEPYTRIRDAGRARRVRVLVGTAEDFDVRSCIAGNVFSAGDECASSQKFLSQWILGPLPVRATRLGSKANWAYEVRSNPDGTGTLLGRMSERFSRRLLEIRSALDNGKRKMPDYVAPLFVLGVRTAVVAPDDPFVSDLHRPWSSSGIWLAPIIVGLPTIPFYPGKPNRNA